MTVGERASIVRGIVRQVVHDLGYLFASPPPLFGTHGLGCRVVGASVEPAGQHRTVSQRLGFAREVGEYGLGDIFGQMRVSRQLTQRRGVNEIEVSPDQLREGLIGAISGETDEKSGVILHMGWFMAPAGDESAQKFQVPVC